MQQLSLKPTHKLVKNYYEVLGQFGQLSIDHEGAVRSAFQSLLANCGKKLDLTLVPEYSFQPPKLNPIRIDGALLNPFKLAHGYWEAKDEHDDLDKEIRAKFDRGYPRTNIIFQAPERAVLYQHGVRQGTNEDIRDAKNLVELLKAFFGYREPHIEEWDEAVAEFKDHIPEIAKAVEEKIEEQRLRNPLFVERFNAFYELCRQSINPNLSVQAVEKMLVQHLLTERIFRKIFDNPDFTRRNVIAVEIEKVIDSMTRREFSRDAFLKDLDRFYRAIELAAENTETYKQKQDFINTVYERFFQGYSPKEADTHGIVYTPQPIVDFMVRSVEDILQKEFGRSLSDKGVHILDPFVGTGNFITRVMKEIRTSALPYKYENELHCNEVMLLPYYVASMNIEHEYMERAGEYKPFPGICLVDTFELAEPEQRGLSFMAEENTERVRRQKEAPIFVIIGNPPYNTQQLNENDQNRNRQYKHMDARVQETYARTSTAALKNKLSDPYVKAFRFAADRIGADGIIHFVSNGGFIDQVAFDGMRKCLTEEYESIYVLDLGGNVRKNPDISGTTHNVFGIQVGVSITLLVKRSERKTGSARIFYNRVPDDWTKERKYEELASWGDVSQINWQAIRPDTRNNWLTANEKSEFESFLAMGEKGSKGAEGAKAVFRLFSLGVATNRDTWVYSYSEPDLLGKVQKTIEAYTARMQKIRRTMVNAFNMGEDDRVVKWTDRLLEAAKANRPLTLDPSRVTVAIYRPFSRRFLYFDSLLNQRRYQQHRIFPLRVTTNVCICANDAGSRTPLSPLAVGVLPDLHVASSDGFQCFPFYTYDVDGSNRRENITDWALSEFRTHYHDPNITKWDIFHYVYAVLHHPEYRERYAANLRRELPRIPFVGRTADPSARAEAVGRDDSVEGAEAVGRDDNVKGDGGDRGPSATLRSAQDDISIDGDDSGVFRAFVEAGRRLAELHVNYEQQDEYPLERVEKGQLNWRVEKMRLSKDKSALVYNDFLTLKGIPPETSEYRLGNRSALEWVIDQYQVSTDKRSGIVNDPNRDDDPEYIVRLIGQVITVSLETVRVVKGLPALVVSGAEKSAAG